MNDVNELKRYVGVHARGQGIDEHVELLARISHDGDGPGSWVGEWSAAAARMSGAGRHLDASRRYIMARFPFVDGPARQEALERAIACFERWRSGRDIHRLEVPLAGGTVVGWHSGLAASSRRPLLLLMGGNVSVKEQWAASLPVFRRLGLAAIVVDMPRCGENTTRYDASSPAVLTELLDAVAERADVSRTYVLALSFAGHLALRCALRDRRIRGVVTAGAPVNAFFTDTGWRARVPKITIDTIAHTMGAEPEQVFDRMRGWELLPHQLAGLDAPVAYVASRRDEIIPPADPALIRDHVPRASILEHDDVHGSPSHVRESQLWSARALARMAGVGGPRAAVLDAMWRVARWRSRAGGPGGAGTSPRSPR